MFEDSQGDLMLGAAVLGLALVWLLFHVRKRAGEQQEVCTCADKDATLVNFAKGMKDYALGMRAYARGMHAYAQGMHAYALGMKELALCSQSSGESLPSDDSRTLPEFACTDRSSSGCSSTTTVQRVNGRIITSVIKNRNGKESVARFENGVLVSQSTYDPENDRGDEA